MLGMPAGAQEAMMERFESLQTIVKQVNQEFADPVIKKKIFFFLHFSFLGGGDR